MMCTIGTREGKACLFRSLNRILNSYSKIIVRLTKYIKSFEIFFGEYYIFSSIYLPPITICLGRAGLVAKAETIESDVAPCHNCANVISVGLLCFGLGFFCD